jgi:pSer/pThr/pTyr-binding forkhead associated (FHA) protein
MYKLVISDDEGKTTVVPLVRDEVTIGRKEGNTIRLTERNVSRRHARLFRDDGAFFVEDLGSYNGVKVNGRRIEAPVRLNDGDHILIGDYQLALQEEAAEEPEPSARPRATAPDEPAPPARLVMLTPPAPGAEFALSGPRTRIGRAEDLEVWVNHRSISREHAEVVDDGERFRVVDLGSANGLRVNGEEVRERALEPGDVLELGQVRFRFVGEGEAYVFDADATVQMGAVSAPEEETSRWPLLVAAVILIAAFGVGGFIFFSDRADGADDQAIRGAQDLSAPPEPDPAPSPPEPVKATPEDAGRDEEQAAAESREIAIATAVEACQVALAAESYADAITQADTALSWEPDNVPATDCRAAAKLAVEEEELFTRGKAAFDDGDVEAAHFAFQELPEESRFRDEPVVAEAARGYAEAQLEEGRELLRRDPLEARRRATTVAEMESLNRSLYREAETLRRLARRAISRKRASRGSPEASADSRSSHGGSSSDGPASSSSSSTSSGGASPLEMARECLVTGRGNACIVRALEGRARTPDGFAMLIETYRAMGNRPKMRQAMSVFIRRFPSHPKTGRYRTQLENQ